jgi:hypothetical protein
VAEGEVCYGMMIERVGKRVTACLDGLGTVEKALRPWRRHLETVLEIVHGAGRFSRGVPLHGVRRSAGRSPDIRQV